MKIGKTPSRHAVNHHPRLPPTSSDPWLSSCLPGRTGLNAVAVFLVDGELAAAVFLVDRELLVFAGRAYSCLLIRPQELKFFPFSCRSPFLCGGTPTIYDAVMHGLNACGSASPLPSLGISGHKDLAPPACQGFHSKL
ncbi:hypothetical protein ZWY2020_029708 [Hordeum vulgare]|nr:hypothetical protein ZWY2020_029708 [Hordeum vulgare]